MNSQRACDTPAETTNAVWTMKANCRRGGRDGTRFRVYSPKPLGDLMKVKSAFTITICFVALALVLGGLTSAQQRNGGGERFPQPGPEKEVTITPIPGVIAAGAK